MDTQQCIHNYLSLTFSVAHPAQVVSRRAGASLVSKHCHQVIVATAVTTRVCRVEPCLIYIPSYLRTHCSPSGRSKGSYSTASCCTACCCFGPITFPSAMACALSAYKEGEYSVAISSTSTMPAHCGCMYIQTHTRTAFLSSTSLKRFLDGTSCSCSWAVQSSYMSRRMVNLMS